MAIQADTRGKIYRRTTDGVEDFITVKEALAEVNDLMMNRKRDYKEMSSSQGHHTITYRNGVKVALTEIDAADMPAEDGPGTWTVASHRTMLHRFTEATGNGRAVCNKRFTPWKYGNGYAFKTRTEHKASEYADLYSFCPRCEAKS